MVIKAAFGGAKSLPEPMLTQAYYNQSQWDFTENVQNILAKKTSFKI